MFDSSKPYGDVSGAYFGARFYQNGHYYDAGQKYLFSNPGIAPPPGCKPRVKMDGDGNPVGDPEELPEGTPQPRAPAAAPPPPPPAPAPTPSPTPTPAPTDPNPSAQTPTEPDQSPTLTREQQLMQMPVPKLQQLMKAAGQDPISGPGAKAKLVKWLLDNTT